MFLRLSKNHILGPNKVFLSLHGLKEERKANADAAVAAKNSVSGDRNSGIISIVELWQAEDSVCLCFKFFGSSPTPTCQSMWCMKAFLVSPRCVYSGRH